MEVITLVLDIQHVCLIYFSTGFIYFSVLPQLKGKEENEECAFSRFCDL